MRSWMNDMAAAGSRVRIVNTGEMCIRDRILGVLLYLTRKNVIGNILAFVSIAAISIPAFYLATSFIDVAVSYTHLDVYKRQLLSSAFYTGMFEVISHDMPKAQALEHIRKRRRFYTAGWQTIFSTDGGDVV